MALCTEGDLLAYGVTPGSIPNPGRLCSSVLAATDAFELDRHLFATGVEVSFRAEAGGTLPSPIEEDVTYYVVRLSHSRFSVALTLANALLGVVVNLTSDGDRVVVVGPDRVATAIEYASSFVEQHLIAHAIPLDPASPVPPVVKGVTASIAAAVLQSADGGTNETSAAEERAQKMLDRWSKGAPVRTSTTALSSANTAVSASGGQYASTYGVASTCRDDEVIP